LKKYLAQQNSLYEAEKEIRKKLRGGEESENEGDFEYREDWVEELEDRKEIVIDA